MASSIPCQSLKGFFSNKLNYSYARRYLDRVSGYPYTPMIGKMGPVRDLRDSAPTATSTCINSRPPFNSWVLYCLRSRSCVLTHDQRLTFVPKKQYWKTAKQSTKYPPMVESNETGGQSTTSPRYLTTTTCEHVNLDGTQTRRGEEIPCSTVIGALGTFWFASVST